MKKLLVMLLVVFVVGVAACPPPPEKPECPEGTVLVEDAEYVQTTYKRVCTTHWYWWFGWHSYQRCRTVVDVPGHYTDPVCKVPEVKEGCAFEYYVLQGNYPCYLMRNRDLDDKKSELPDRYDGTGYMYGLCSLKDCNGKVTQEFEWNGNFVTVCDDPEPCTECLK